MGHHQLDELDYKILKLVASNARIPFLEVARECNGLSRTETLNSFREIFRRQLPIEEVEDLD